MLLNMARERNILLNVLKNFVNSLKPRQFRGNLVGTDHLGNKYYEIPKSGSNRRDSRWFVPKGGDETKFDQGLPSEWESWLRQRRKTPPTEAEIAANLQIMKTKQSKGLEILEKFKASSTPPGQAITFPQREEYEKYPGKKT